MATISADAGEVRERFSDSVAFDVTFAVLSTLFLGGLYVDGWAHNHINVIDTFFTPWHAMFYGGGLITAAFTAATLVRFGGLSRAYVWSAFGFVVFFVSGLGDLVWHTVFGIEASTDALLSPTHLGLATGMALVLSGPLRAALARRAGGIAPASRYRAYFAAILSLTAVFSLLTFMSQYAPALYPLGTGPAPSGDMLEIRIARIVLTNLWWTALFAGFLLFAARNFGRRLPFGWITMFAGLNAALMATQTDTYASIPGVLIAALCADGLYFFLKPDARRETAFRWFAFGAPVLYWTFHDITILLTHLHFYVSVHLWTGLVVISGIVGLLVSFVANPGDERAASA